MNSVLEHDQPNPKVSLPSYNSFAIGLQQLSNTNGEDSFVLNSTVMSIGNENIARERYASSTSSDRHRITSGHDNVQQFPTSIKSPANKAKNKIRIKIPLVSPSRYTCKECEATFRQIQHFRVHLMKHLVQGNENSKMFQCSNLNCERQFYTKRSCKQHELQHAQMANFNCERVRQVFKDKQDF